MYLISSKHMLVAFFFIWSCCTLGTFKILKTVNHEFKKGLLNTRWTCCNGSDQGNAASSVSLNYIQWGLLDLHISSNAQAQTVVISWLSHHYPNPMPAPHQPSFFPTNFTPNRLSQVTGPCSSFPITFFIIISLLPVLMALVYSLFLATVVADDLDLPK